MELQNINNNNNNNNNNGNYNVISTDENNNNINDKIIHHHNDIESNISSPKKFNNKDLIWETINFKVNNKIILKDCWGKIETGEICAVMGPSGAGKSSLLNVLAGRSASAEGISISGSVYVGGKPINPVQFRRNIAYVMQEDALMATQTPEEVLRFSASLRLPRETSKEEIENRVQNTLKNLGITNCKDVLIGGALIKGISGGQKKRTSIGIEIITNPDLLFLDEPTSGLDSHTAYNIIELLKEMATNNTVVLLTIHQPSSEIFYKFDKVIYMKDGRIFYQGLVKDVVNHFSLLGYQCPNNYNPCDYVMSLCQVESSEELEKKGLFMDAPPVRTDRSGSIDLSTTIGDHSKDFIKAPASFFTQLGWLLHRECIGLLRNKGALGARFGITIFLNTLFGFIFLNAGRRDNADSIAFSTHFGAVTMVTISSMFGSAQPAMLEFPFERPMFMREYATGTYSTTPYFISKSFVELPLTLLQVIVQYIIVYNMMGFQGFFVYEVLAAWALSVASSSVAVALGCAISEAKKVTEMAPVLFVPQMLFAGFFVKISQIPIFLQWAQYLCSLKYAMNIIVMTEFSSSLPSCQGAAAVNCNRIIESNQIHPHLWYVYMILLIALFLAFRITGAILLTIRANRFY